MAPKTTPIALTIAGSDPSGGAGLQADLKTFAALGVYGCAVVTALTAQNTRGVSAVWSLPEGAVAGQIASVLDDVPVGAVKLGMLLNAQVIGEVAAQLSQNRLPLICDPVMVATSGDRLLDNSALDALRSQLLPRSDLVTPNIPEAAVLLNEAQASSVAEMEAQARRLLQLGPSAVLLKGGHLGSEQATDVLVWRDAEGEHSEQLTSRRVPTRNTHGTGCSLAAAVAAGIALGQSLPEAVRAAKVYLSAAIAHADELQVGSGAGPVNHQWQRREG